MEPIDEEHRAWIKAKDDEEDRLLTGEAAMSPERISEILQLVYEPAEPEQWQEYHDAMAELAQFLMKQASEWSLEKQP